MVEVQTRVEPEAPKERGAVAMQLKDVAIALVQVIGEISHAARLLRPRAAVDRYHSHLTAYGVRSTLVDRSWSQDD